MPNLYSDAVIRQLENIGKPITRTSTTVADLTGQGLDISSLLLLLYLSGIFGKGGGGTAEPMLPNTPLPTTLGAQQLQYPSTPPSATGMGGISGTAGGGVPSFGNIDIMSLINMFSRIR